MINSTDEDKAWDTSLKNEEPKNWLALKYKVIDGEIKEYNGVAIAEGEDVIVAFTMTLDEMTEGMEVMTDESKEDTE